MTALSIKNSKIQEHIFYENFEMFFFCQNSINFKFSKTQKIKKYKMITAKSRGAAEEEARKIDQLETMMGSIFDAFVCVCAASPALLFCRVLK